MICKNCGADYKSTDTTFPYCGTINELALDKQNSTLSQEHSLHFKRLVIGICSILMLTVILSTSLSFYYYNYEDFYRHAQVKGLKHSKNKSLIDTYLNDGQYARAPAIAYTTDPTYTRFENYPKFYEQLNMINNYYRFLYDIQDYIIGLGNLDYLDCSEYHFDYAKELYDTFPITERSIKIKEILTASLDLYLKYYYQLTDEEILDFKEAINIDEYKIEDTHYFEGIIKERIEEYGYVTNVAQRFIFDGNYEEEFDKYWDLAKMEAYYMQGCTLKRALLEGDQSKQEEFNICIEYIEDYINSETSPTFQNYAKAYLKNLKKQKP